MVNVLGATELELVLFFKKSGNVEKVLFDFDVKEPRNDVADSEDEAEPLKETHGNSLSDVFGNAKGQKGAS